MVSVTLLPEPVTDDGPFTPVLSVPPTGCSSNRSIRETLHGLLEFLAVDDASQEQQFLTFIESKQNSIITDGQASVRSTPH